MTTQNKINKVYLLVSNHRAPQGIAQQKDIIYRSFKKLNSYELIETDIIIPNQINIIIEELNIDLINVIKKTKHKYRATKIVLFLTEYLVHSFFGYQLNTFDFKTKFAHFFLSTCLNIPFVKFIKHRNKFENNNITFFIRSFIESLVIFPISLIFDKDGLVNSIDITRREYCLKMAKDLFDLYISNHCAINNSYKNFTNSKIVLMPTYIDKSKAIKARNNFIKNSNYIPGIFFSGRLTKYRKKLLYKFWDINSLYPSSTLFSYQSSIKNFKNNDMPKIPIFELYIKQEKNWPYSSPMRTLLSIEEGFIPINAGVFKDHSLNKLTLNISPHSTPEDLCKLFLEVDVKESFDKLDILIEKHNKEEDILKEHFNLALNSLFD